MFNLYHGGFLPHNYGELAGPRRKKKRKKKDACGSIKKIKKGMAKGRYLHAARMMSQNVVKVDKTGQILGVAAGVGASVAAAQAATAATATAATAGTAAAGLSIAAPPFSTILAVAPAAVGLAAAITGGVMHRRARIMAWDKKEFRKRFRKAKKWSKRKRRIKAKKYVRKYIKLCRKGRKRRWFGLSRKRKKTTKSWKFKEADARMWLAAIYAAQKGSIKKYWHKKKKKKKVAAVLPPQAPQKPNYTNHYIIGAVVLAAIVVVINNNKKKQNQIRRRQYA